MTSLNQDTHRDHLLLSCKKLKLDTEVQTKQCRPCGKHSTRGQNGAGTWKDFPENAINMTSVPSVEVDDVCSDATKIFENSFGRLRTMISRGSSLTFALNVYPGSRGIVRGTRRSGLPSSFQPHTTRREYFASASRTPAITRNFPGKRNK